MKWPEIFFATFGGLRGAVSLILAQVVVTEQNPNADSGDRKVTAQVSQCAMLPRSWFTTLLESPCLKEMHARRRAARVAAKIASQSACQDLSLPGSQAFSLYRCSVSRRCRRGRTNAGCAQLLVLKLAFPCSLTAQVLHL